MIDWKNVKYVKPGIYVTSYSAEEIAANTDEHGIFHAPAPRSETPTPETERVIAANQWDTSACFEVKLVNHARSLERRLQAALAERDAANTALDHNLAVANAAGRHAMAERDATIRTLRKTYSAIEIASMTGLTRQRIHQILNEADAAMKEGK